MTRTYSLMMFFFERFGFREMTRSDRSAFCDAGKDWIIKDSEFGVWLTGWDDESRFILSFYAYEEPDRIFDAYWLGKGAFDMFENIATFEARFKTWDRKDFPTLVKVWGGETYNL